MQNQQGGGGAAALKRGHIDCRLGKERARGALQGPLALKTKIKTKSCTILLTNMVTRKP